MIDREQLDEIILQHDTNDWWQPELFIQNTKHLLPRELTILADPPPEAENHNCFIHALGLSEDTTVIKATNGFIYDTFIKHLISIGELERTTDPQPGDFVVYQDLEQYPDHLTHMGVLQSDSSVISKWAWGPLFKHTLWDVPASYGNNIFYIKGISATAAQRLFETYQEFNQKPAS